MAIEYFCCYHSYERKLAKLSDQEVGRLFRALLAYSARGEDSELAGRESIAFDFIADDIDRAKENYEEQCRKNQENGKLGGRPKKRQLSKKAEGFSETQKTENKDKSKTESEDKSETEPFGVDKPPQKGAADTFATFAAGAPDLLAALKDFEQMRKTIKKPMTDRAKRMLVNKLHREFSPEEWIAVLEQSISHCWADVYAQKDASPRSWQQSQSHHEDAMSDLQEIHRMFDGEADE